MIASSSTKTATGKTHTSSKISVADYDKMKHCTTDRTIQPTAIQYLENFNCGRVSVNSSNGTVTREFTIIVKENQIVTISTKGHWMPAWTFNGTIPGPTMRMTEGDHVKITLINDANNTHPHSIHMHSIHPGVMDGVEVGIVAPGHSFTYDFIASPFGVYPYHCHVEPIADHINRGLYGMFIIDPKTPRPQMHEMAMMLNGYDLNLDQEGPFVLPKPGVFKDFDVGSDRDNELYSVNGVAFEYIDRPIHLKLGEPVRIYLVNMLEFDRVNSFHLHGNMFNYFPAGTSMQPEFQNDIVTLSPGDRGIIEFTPQYNGRYMFHAHQAEFASKGWTGFFDVTTDGESSTDTNTAAYSMGATAMANMVNMANDTGGNDDEKSSSQSSAATTGGDSNVNGADGVDKGTTSNSTAAAGDNNNDTSSITKTPGASPFTP
jgi:FtsP/CotA-like multicopper oxidase with cupredoxin domain